MQTPSIEVLFEDRDLLVVDKPPGMVVHPARGQMEGTLVEALAGVAAGGGEPTRAGIVHRLDRDTSGLLVVAKHEEAYRALKSLIGSRAVQRDYIALVEGKPPAQNGTIDAPIGRDRSIRTRRAIGGAAPRSAKTHFSVRRFLPKTTLLDVRLETGRTHQIRVHLSSIKHPVVGDPEYGRAGLYGLTRQFLHACHLRFDHPFTERQVDVESPLPQDLKAALALAEQQEF